MKVLILGVLLVFGFTVFSQEANSSMDSTSGQEVFKTICKSTIEKGDTPLIVVDGKIWRKNPNKIDVNKIKKIRVVKGAEASALYGVMGANGVLLIIIRKD